MFDSVMDGLVLCWYSPVQLWFNRYSAILEHHTLTGTG
jgi:hypothetical protein